MINAYNQGKDLYAEIASLSFNTTYENCLEFRPDGTTNPEGKERRSQAKSILLGRPEVMPLYIGMYIENLVNRIAYGCAYLISANGEA